MAATDGRHADGIRRAALAAVATLGLSCSLVTGAGAVGDAYKQEAIRDLNAFQPPTNTPFLPVRETRTATAFPATQTPSPSLTILFALTGTDTASPTLTVIVYPSVTPTPMISLPAKRGSTSPIATWISSPEARCASCACHWSPVRCTT